MRRHDSNKNLIPRWHFAENKHVIKGQHYKHAQEHAEGIILSSILNYSRHVFINVKCYITILQNIND